MALPVYYYLMVPGHLFVRAAGVWIGVGGTRPRIEEGALTAQAQGFWCGGEEERAFTALSSGAITAPHLLVYSGRGIHPLKLLLLLTTVWGT